MLIKCLSVGNMEENCYIVTDEKTLECAIVDPGDESNVILDYAESNDLKIRAVLLTHGHFDHTGAVEEIVYQTNGVRVYMHKDDAVDSCRRDPYRYSPPTDTQFVAEGDIIPVGGLAFKVLETPGHSAGSVTYMCENALFTGDTLFRDSCGRTDLPGGDMETELASLKRLGELEGNFEVYPGHMDTTTLDMERGNNYYMRYALGK